MIPDPRSQPFKPSPLLRHPRVADEVPPFMNALISRARDGDKQAFEQLYRENVGRVYALCLRMMGDSAMADELTQDAFVRAWQKLDSFRGESAFSSWLHRLTVNLILQNRRSDRRRSSWLVTSDDPELVGATPTESPISTAIDLEDAIRRLPPGAREVFVLHDVEGYRHSEIAELAGIAPGTSKAQLHRARRLLRETLTS